MSMINDFPVLDRETELALARRFKARADQAARKALIESHLRLVVAIGLRYRRYGLPLSELISEGNFGLVHALSKFDPERSNRFATYAEHWIRAYVLNYVMRSWSLVGGGSGPLRTKVFFKLRRERARVANLVGEGDEARRLLAERLAVPEAKLQTMLQRLDARDLRIDTLASDDSRPRWIDTLPSHDRNQEELLVSNELNDHACDAVRSALAVLDERERYIVESHLMAHPDDELSLAAIGKQLGISRERTRQLEERAKRKLRRRIEQLARARGVQLSDVDGAARPPSAAA
jgi:RNA polymerase sigma-32 factor